MRSVFLLLALLGIASCRAPIQEDDQFVENLLRTQPDKFRSILDNRKTLEIQIIYTQINRDSLNRPSFKSFSFNVDTTRYFYPASTVKLPIVLLALEKLNKLHVTGLDRNTTMLSDSVYAGQLPAHRDTTSETGLPSIAQYAKKILVVSDNDAYNRLYEFLGQQAINKSLYEKGYSARVLHRLDRPLSPDQNRHTEVKRFVKNDSTIYKQEMLINPDSIKPARIVLKGKSHYDNSGRFFNAPFDFTYKNNYPLTTQIRVLQSLIFPDAVKPSERFNLSASDREFVLQYMSQLPRETSFPAYYTDTAYYYDAYCKFLMYGTDNTKIPPSIRIFNKVGDAYGFLIDNAYVVDFDNKIEFMLSAVINCNVDDVYNGDHYAYDSIGYPFMKDLGQIIYQYELKRERNYRPDLSKFKLKYDR